MKKGIIKLVIICLVVLFCVAGCNFTSSISYTFKVETGDSIGIELDTTDEYSMTSTLPMDLTKAGKTVGTGIFVSLDTYDMYVNAAKTNSKNVILDTGSENGITYTFYCYDDSQYNYIIKIDNSNTGFFLSNEISQESAEECFERLTFVKQ